MKIFYDTEFLEDGHTISLISIGMVAEDGRELYAINMECDLNRLLAHDWLMANVAPSLPLAKRAHTHGWYRPFLTWDPDLPDFEAVKLRTEIAANVAAFIQATPEPELWAWYGAYDHVALCQLFGRMIDLPDGVPMFTNDLKQEAVRLGNPRMPRQAEGEHNALADARHNRLMHEFLIVERRRAEGDAR